MKKGGFMKDAIILFVITLIAGICLGGVYEITKEPIAKAQIAANLKAYQAVLPEAADFKSSDELKEQVKASAEALKSLGYGNVLVDDCLQAVDASGTGIGYVVNATSNDGYNGAVSVSVGIDANGAVTRIEFLALNETPGLGMNAGNPEFKDQFDGKTAESFTVTKGGAASDNEINAVSGATITSNAAANAVNAAVYFVNNCISK